MYEAVVDAWPLDKNNHLLGLAIWDWGFKIALQKFWAHDEAYMLLEMIDGFTCSVFMKLWEELD